MQRGAQENLWPKFILESAPLRATSSALPYCIRGAICKALKIRKPSRVSPVGFSPVPESFTSVPNLSAKGRPTVVEIPTQVDARDLSRGRSLV
jgi:hypothetical protein